MLALAQDGETEVWPAGYDALGVIPSFPFSEVDSAALGYRVRLGRWVAPPGEDWTLSEVSGVEVRGFVEGDEGFMGVVAPSYQDTNSPVRHACFNDTDLACAVVGHTLLILRDYVAVFAAVIAAPEDERDAVLRENTIAIRFDARIHAIKAHGPRFAIATDRDVVVLDSRRLPAMPLALGHDDARPSLHALVLGGAFPTQKSRGGKTRRVDAKLAIDERALYLFASAAKVVTVHAFGE
ncbi:uncharacterized protein LOC62_03G005163 [Vanrija pseudolonga]|uniref:Uncharacterized protein n=1 Tax=Vanrija pseudolonga TaxID=143232 RepID=A0AAF0Y7T8_9TREE|nr:hypothetical protein LOC62_03G005163 [Vanrija pseudolonga]